MISDLVTNQTSYSYFSPEHLTIEAPNVAVADAGATSHYFNMSAAPFLSNVQEASHPVHIAMPG